MTLKNTLKKQITVWGHPQDIFKVAGGKLITYEIWLRRERDRFLIEGSAVEINKNHRGHIALFYKKDRNDADIEEETAG